MSRSVVAGFQSEEVLLTEQVDVSANTGDLANLCNTGIHILLNISDVQNGATCVVKLEGKDPVSAAYYTLLESAELSTTGVKELICFPQSTVAANASSNAFLPPVFKITVTVTLGATPGATITYTVGATFLG
jgi:hypothetical protein